MIGSFRSEWIKLGRRNFIVGGFGTIIGLAILLAVTSILTLDTTTNPTGPPGGFGGGLDLESAGGFLAGLDQAAGFVGIVALALFAANVAAEFSSGSIRVLLTTQPRRGRVLGGKLLALGAFVVLAVLYAAILSALVSFLLAGSRGVDTAAWTSIEAVPDAISVYLNVTLAAFVYGLFGAMLGMLTRSSAVSIAAGVAYFLLGETLLLQPLWDRAEQWLPAGALSALAAGGTDAVSYAAATTVAAGFAVVAWIVTSITLQRRDITD